MSQTQSSSDGCDGRNDDSFLYSNPFAGNDGNPVFSRPTPEAQWMFARQPQPPPFYPYFQPAPFPPQRVQAPRTPGPTCSNENTSEGIANVPDNGASSTTVCNSGAAKSSTKWGEVQTSVLVTAWKDRIEAVESARATETWHKIVLAVNEVGSKKTVKQCKDKLRNLKKAYKDAKLNNNATGRAPQSSPYFDDFDEVLGTRPVVVMPGILQSGQANSGESQEHPPDESEESDEEYDRVSPSGSDSSPTDIQRAKRKAPKKDQRVQKAKKGRVTTASAMIDLTEKLVGMQNSQMEMMEKAQKRTEDLLVKLEAEQRKMDEMSRRRDQEFFLRMAEIMKK